MIFFKTKSQRNRETTTRQNEHLHHRIIFNDPDVPCHVQETGQVDRASNGRTTLEKYQRCKLVHGRTLQTLVFDGSGVKTFNSASMFLKTVHFTVLLSTKVINEIFGIKFLGCRWFPVCSRM